MNRIRLAAVTAALALGLAGLVGAAPAGAAVSTARTVAFADVVAGSVTATGPGTFSLAGSGVASPLGAVRYSGNVVITSAPGAAVLTDVLTETLTTTGGDSIKLRCEQSATPVGTTGVLRGNDRWTVVGGTGKYAKASGSGAGETYIDNLQSFGKTATGSITF